MTVEVLMQDDPALKETNSKEPQERSTAPLKSSEIVEPQTESKDIARGSIEQPHHKKHKEKKVWITKTHLEELQKKGQEAKLYLDHLQRLQAEFENYRKRNLKEREEFRKFALEEFIMELLGILDNFERALESFQTTQDLQNILTGIQMIYKQLQDCLIRRGVNPIEAKGVPFDPLRHEAIDHEETEEHPPNQVINQLTRGYLLHGKVIRPSKVKVSKKPSTSESGPTNV